MPLSRREDALLSRGPEKGFYHCFGCGVHGTALTFLLEHDRLEFVQAVETLAAMAGVPGSGGRA